MKPKTLMMENVPALAKDERMRIFLKEIERLGYFVGEKTVLIKNTADFGVPQRRKRMILQASRLGSISEPSPSKKIKTVRDTIGNMKRPSETGDILHDYYENRSDRVNKMISLIPRDGGSRVDIPKEYWLPCHIRNPGGYTDVYGRMAWDSVAPTITGGCSNPSKGRFLHPDQNRTITLREAALLQTFPKRYKFSMLGGKDAVALMIGNALPPEFIRRHAIHYVKHLEGYEG
jgi:DNA (cytosine-5)-methyltransferase 1